MYGAGSGQLHTVTDFSFSITFQSLEMLITASEAARRSKYTTLSPSNRPDLSWEWTAADYRQTFHFQGKCSLETLARSCT